MNLRMPPEQKSMRFERVIQAGCPSINHFVVKMCSEGKIVSNDALREINKKKAANHNLKKNKSINYLVSLENINERNINKSTNKDSKPIFSKNNLIYYSTAKNKFYNAKYEQGK